MGLPHIHHTITYTSNGTALKNKRKLKNAIHLVTGVNSFIILNPNFFSLDDCNLIKYLVQYSYGLFYIRLFYIMDNDSYNIY